jgi:hypothetical protein
MCDEAVGRIDWGLWRPGAKKRNPPIDAKRFGIEQESCKQKWWARQGLNL